MGAYIPELVRYLKYSSGISKSVSYQLNIPPLQLLQQISNEYYTLSIADDGIGLPAGHGPTLNGVKNSR